MASIAMKDLLEAGVHFGHQTRRWNPKMKRYIYGSRNGIYIIDLHQSLKLFDDAQKFIQDTVVGGGSVLFVGTKKQASDAVAEAAKMSRQYYVNSRWLGGMLTNFRTIQSRIAHLRELEAMERDGILLKLTKKEAAMVMEEKDRLERFLGGIKDMPRLPAALFIVDLNKEHIAVKEARSLGIPIVAIVDTNCDPDVVDFIIPGNDDAIRAIKLISTKIAEAIIEVKQHEWEDVPVVDTTGMLAPVEGAAPLSASAEARRRQMEEDARGAGFEYDAEGRIVGSTEDASDAPALVTAADVEAEFAASGAASGPTDPMAGTVDMPLTSLELAQDADATLAAPTEPRTAGGHDEPGAFGRTTPAAGTEGGSEVAGTGANSDKASILDAPASS